MRKAKRRCQQLVAAAMCVGMLAGMVPTQVFAEEAQPAAAIAQQEQAPAPSANETETPAPTEEPAAKQTPAPAEEPAAEQTPAPAEEPAAEETAAQAAEVMSAAVQDSENENFGKVLEDQDLVAVRSGASLVESLSTGKQVKVTAEWISGSNSAVDGGGALQEGDAFFKRSRFTLYANVKFDAAHDNTSALLVGSDAGANFRIVPCKTDGTAVLKVNNGTEHKLSKAMTAGEWNALALVYAENDTEGTVAVYLNGEEVLPATGIGFKLSEKSGIVGAVGATFGTGFMRTGLYDELVVTGAADAEAAKVETAARKAAADAVVAVDGVVTVTGAEVEQAAQNVNGWTYKGLGMLNGNSTSNLLLDYKAESPDAYWAMMRYLFGGDYPLFSNIKMEMGNDGNNSTGAEACTMRYEDEEADASRSPGFVMAADAKTINPNVKVSILRWGCPNWVNAYKGTDWYAANYKWYKETIFDAYEKYGYVVDYINPDTNETGNPDSGIIKYFANAIANETDFPEYFTEEAKQAYRSIKIVASDENKGLKIVPMMRGDKDLYDAVDMPSASTTAPTPPMTISRWPMWMTRRSGTARAVRPSVIPSCRRTRPPSTVQAPSAATKARWRCWTASPTPLSAPAGRCTCSSRPSAPSTRASSTAIRSCSPPATRGAAISTMTLCFTCWAISPSLPRPAGRMQATPPVSGACCRALPLRPSVPARTSMPPQALTETPAI